MRPLMLAAAAAATLITASPALAGPTCQDHDGDTIRCGVPGAMPVGWTPSADTLNRETSPLTFNEAFALIYIIGGIFAVIALMPEFDGWSAGDWGKQEGDEEPSQ